MLTGTRETETAQDAQTRWLLAISRPDIPIRLVTDVTDDGVFLRIKQTGQIHTRALVLF
jgi:hypothetical protein